MTAECPWRGTRRRTRSPLALRVLIIVAGKAVHGETQQCQQHKTAMKCLCDVSRLDGGALVKDVLVL